ncbi:hypothetical protein Taro_038629 [Colocasia esculenta]|uniref:Uncharacterized protein n=1 Tax=Colocasia esculenta TaxID=4460 RepID=A0A843W780_COLES|nr:hypothetical protein [Colocasia esculenta]
MKSFFDYSVVFCSSRLPALRQRTSRSPLQNLILSRRSLLNGDWSYIPGCGSSRHFIFFIRDVGLSSAVSKLKAQYPPPPFFLREVPVVGLHRKPFVSASNSPWQDRTGHRLIAWDARTVFFPVSEVQRKEEVRGGRTRERGRRSGVEATVCLFALAWRAKQRHGELCPDMARTIEAV